MNGFRKKMLKEGGNLSWCAPYSSSDGRIQFALNEGEIVSLKLDGKDVDSDVPQIPFAHNATYSETLLEKVARILNSNYDDYEGWDNTHIILEARGTSLKECDCCDCPWFDVCDAMDNPDKWGDPDYPDDP